MTALPMVLMSEDEVAAFGHAREAGFGALQTERGTLPLTAMDVEARVVGIMAAIEVAQTFVNALTMPLEATYIFPLPDRAAVHRFRMEVAGRVIEGVVDERGAARAQYDDAIAAGHRAAITEEERPGVFTLRVGNLLPGEVATIRLSLVGPLPVDDGEVTLQFPLVVAPRYMPGTVLGGEQAGLGAAADTTLVPDASRISPPVRLRGLPHPVRLGIRVTLADRDVRDIASSLHAITEARGEGYRIELAAAEQLDRDFILRWRVDPTSVTVQSTLACADDADGGGGTFLLTLVPPSTTTVGARPRDVVFVIDRSGSMGGWKMVAARRAAARMIDSLTSRDRFCALAFDDQHEGLPELGLLPATDRNRFRAVESLATLEARGGTELAAPLQQAAQMLEGGTVERERVIVLLTDGQVGNEDQILQLLAPALTRTRMFTLGIDQAVNAAFLRRLAAAGGGLCELVESEDRLDAVMAKVHRRIGAPLATELALQAEGITLDATQTAPARLPDVYAGAPVTILGRYRGAAAATATITLVGTSQGDAFTQRVARQPSVVPVPWLAASWARARIRDLEDRYAAGDHGLEPELVAVSKRHQVLSRFTAFLAVDRTHVANPGGGLTQIVQPVAAPAGWESPADVARRPGLRSRSVGGATLPTVRSISRITMQAPAPAPMAAAMPMMSPSLPMMSPSMPGSFGAASAGGGQPSAMAGGPPPAPPMPPGKPRRAPELTTSASEAAAPTAAPLHPAYLASLAILAAELEAQARGRGDAQAVRVIRQRLLEWIEDVRSTGAGLASAAAVEQLVLQLGTALQAGGAGLAAAVAPIAVELARLGTAAGPGAPVPAKPARGAFWK